MKFEFSEENYQWCGQCGGNVRRDVDWCRYCHKKIGSRFLRDERIVHPSNIVDAAAHWLPDFNDVVGKCSQPLQARIHQADLDLARELSEDDEKFLQSKDERRTTSVCSEFPPQAQAAGLVWDIMLSIYGEGRNVEDICKDARLELIGITPDTLNAEGILRRREAETGNACAYCFEFNLKDVDECRFCGSDGTHPPRKVEQVIVLRRLDPDLLHDVFVWEAGYARANDGEALPAELLEKHGLTADIIEREAERHRRSEASFPLSEWRAKQSRLGVKTERPLPDFAVEDLLSLASGCSWERRHDEAMIVYQHAMRRVDECENQLLAKTRILTGLATVAMNRNDPDAYQKYNNEANELRRAGMPAALRKMTAESGQDGAKTGGKPESDHMRKVREANAQLAEQSAPATEVNKVLLRLNKKMSNMMGNTIELAKLRLDADVAREAGELERAATLIELGLSRLRNNVSDVLKQVDLLGMLAHVQKLQGDLDVAEATHKHAISICEELAELGDGQEHPVLEHANFRYGAFLMEQKRYEEAESHFQRALEGDRKHEECLPETLRFRGPYISEVEATIKSELSKLYRATNRLSEAEQAEAELESIQKQLSEQKYKTTGSVRKFTSS